MEILNVAGDDRAAKTIASYLSGGSSNERQGLSIRNKIYEFETEVEGQKSKMIMTSVSENHLINYNFRNNKWSDRERDLLSLFDSAIIKVPDTRYTEIRRTLEREVKTCQTLIIWTYCDADGEGMGFEVMKVCLDVKPNIKIYRARFCTITPQSVRRALDNLGSPNKEISEVADVRRQIDLRTGVAFTRFQRMRLQRHYPARTLGTRANYGICLFPTLGFIVERFFEIEEFKPKPFWAIKVTDVRNEISVEFKWEKNHLFEEMLCQTILDKCRESTSATVESVTCKSESKLRPLPLNTVELAKHCSDMFNFTVKKTMDIALDLYNQGFISYPQTETNIFPEDLDLKPLIDQQTESPEWGAFAKQILNDGLSPQQGRKSDGAHPPIYPKEKMIATLKGDEAKVYEFIVRRFLACLSKDAEVEETIVNLKIADEKFEARGIRTTAKNYLEVYPFKSWQETEIHVYEMGQTFEPTSIEMVNEKTSPPILLTESDLISLKEEHEIGTASTHAEHIESLKLKEHVQLIDGKYLKPGNLGLALVMGYNSVDMGNKITKPDLRKKLVNDLKLVSVGKKNSADVLSDQLTTYQAILAKILTHSKSFDTIVGKYLNKRK